MSLLKLWSPLSTSLKSMWETVSTVGIPTFCPSLYNIYSLNLLPALEIKIPENSSGLINCGLTHRTFISVQHHCVPRQSWFCWVKLLSAEFWFHFVLAYSQYVFLLYTIRWDIKNAVLVSPISIIIHLRIILWQIRSSERPCFRQRWREL